MGRIELAYVHSLIDKALCRLRHQQTLLRDLRRGAHHERVIALSEDGVLYMRAKVTALREQEALLRKEMGDAAPVEPRRAEARRWRPIDRSARGGRLGRRAR